MLDGGATLSGTSNSILPRRHQEKKLHCRMEDGESDERRIKLTVGNDGQSYFWGIDPSGSDAIRNLYIVQ